MTRHYSADDCERDEAITRAREALLQAAPDLLSALEEIVYLDDEYGLLLNGHDVHGCQLVTALHLCRAAIDKAKGISR